jgi:hypothetical protein
VLKAALSGTTLNNNMNNNIMSNVQLLATSEPRAALGAVTSATLNFAASPYYTLTTGGSVTISFTNLPPAGQLAVIKLQITVASTAHQLILPSSVSVGTTNVQGYASNTITFNQTGTYEFQFETSDGGITFSIFDLNRNRDPIYLPSKEDLAASAAASLAKTTSYFSTAAAETATLAAGVEGQVKVFAMYADSGDMVITVSNAGWQTSGTGTITFSAIGQSCMLMYINAKWFCVGNNGAVFG